MLLVAWPDDVPPLTSVCRKLAWSGLQILVQIELGLDFGVAADDSSALQLWIGRLDCVEYLRRVGYCYRVGHGLLCDLFFCRCR